MLDSRQMGGAFQALRTYDLIWGPSVQTYLKGERSGVNDLMSWNADGTRMAYRMHTDYLHQLYLNNDLAEGRYVAQGMTLDLRDITVPMFVVGTETDHVAPWPSVYKIGKLVHSTDYTFCLTSGGHNAGIISGPQHPKRRHRVLSTRAGSRLPAPTKLPREGRPDARLVVADVRGLARGALERDEGQAARDGCVTQGPRAARRCAGDVRARAIVASDARAFGRYADSARKLAGSTAAERPSSAGQERTWPVALVRAE